MKYPSFFTKREYFALTLAIFLHDLQPSLKVSPYSKDMNVTELFYIIAIIFMIAHLVLLIVGAVVVYRVITTIKTSVNRVERVVSSMSIAKYSLQMTVLKNVLRLFGRGGERT